MASFLSYGEYLQQCRAGLIGEVRYPFSRVETLLEASQPHVKKYIREHGDSKIYRVGWVSPYTGIVGVINSEPLSFSEAMSLTVTLQPQYADHHVLYAKDVDQFLNSRGTQAQRFFVDL